MINIPVSLAVLQEVMDAMDDMASDSHLLDMKQSRIHQFDAARDALRAALEQPDAKPPATAPEGWKLVPMEPTRDMLTNWIKADVVSNRTAPDLYCAMLAAAPQPPTVKECLTVEQPQDEQEPYLYYDPANGDNWTQEAINDGCCPPDGLIALYTKEKK